MTIETKLNKAMKNLSSQKVIAMQKKVDDALAERAKFKSSSSNVKDGAKKDFEKLVTAIKNDRHNCLARLCGVTDTDVNKDVINRVRMQGSRANLKALFKMQQLAEFLYHGNTALETVTQCFLRSLIAAHEQKVEFISNNTSKRILSGLDLTGVPESVRDEIAKYQHKTMSGGSDTQSSQMRTQLDNFGLTKPMTVDGQRGFTVNADHLIFEAVRDIFAVEKANA